MLARHLVWTLSRVPAQRLVSPTTEMSSHIHCNLENSAHASSEVNINLENLSQLRPEACLLPDSRILDPVKLITLTTRGYFFWI